MIYESECRFCGAETEWTEPHLYDLPQKHPKRQWAWISACGDCHDAYGPPILFDEWDAVRFEWESCPFCGNRNIRWIGTADWSNPRTLLQKCSESMAESAESDEAVTVAAEIREQFVIVTSVCHKCAPSAPEKALYRNLKEQVNQATLEEQMWEPVDVDEMEIALDPDEDGK